MKNLVFVVLPKVETTFPPGALAILSSVAKLNDYSVKIVDYNLDLLDKLTEDEWNTLEAWNTFSLDHIDQQLDSKIKNIFIDSIKNTIDSDTCYVCFSVFSYFSNRIAEKILTLYQEHFSVPTIVGGTGVSTDTSASNKNT